MKFEEIINFLTEFGKGEIFLLENEEKKIENLKKSKNNIYLIKKEIEQFPIKNCLLEHFKDGYDNFTYKIKKKIGRI